MILLFEFIFFTDSFHTCLATPFFFAQPGGTPAFSWVPLYFPVLTKFLLFLFPLFFFSPELFRISF